MTYAGSSAESRQSHNVFLQAQCVWTTRPWANEFTLTHTAPHTHTYKGSILEHCTKTIRVTSEDRRHYDVCHYFVNSSPLENVTALRQREADTNLLQTKGKCSRRWIFLSVDFEGRLRAATDLAYLTNINVEARVGLFANRDWSELARTPPLYSSVWIKYEVRCLNGNSPEESRAGVCVCMSMSTCAIEGPMWVTTTWEAGHWVTFSSF